MSRTAQNQWPGEAQSLRELVALSRSGPALPFPVCAYVLVQVAHQLATEGTHGEILPETILIDSDGEIRLAEAGAAELGDQVAYLAPERMKGKAADPRSDLFSLAGVFVEALTGVPFHSSKLVGQAGKNPLGLVDPDVPTGLVPLIRKALSVKAEERFASTSDLLTAIRPLLPKSLLDEGKLALVSELGRQVRPAAPPSEPPAAEEPVSHPDRSSWTETQAAPTLTTRAPSAQTRERLGYVEKRPRREWRIKKRYVVLGVVALGSLIWLFQFRSFLAPLSEAPKEQVDTSGSQPVYQLPGGKCLVELDTKPSGALVRLNRTWSGGMTPSILLLPCQRTVLLTLKSPAGDTTHQLFRPTQRIEAKKYKISKTFTARLAAWLRLLVAFQSDVLEATSEPVE